MKIRTIPTQFTLLITLISIFSLNTLLAQEVEVQGSLKVTQMDADETGEELVIRNADGSLGTRSVATLPTPPPPIDTSRNLASDFELAKFLCECPNPPPFMIKKLIESGYTQSDLINAGIPAIDVINGGRSGILVDTRDNKTYKTVKIGDQVWMAENINIGQVINSSTNQTNNSLIEKYCYDNIPSNCSVYGGVYLWDEAMQFSTVELSQGICPDGWHIPSDAEWKTLEMELGMTSTEANTTGWRGTDEGSKLAGEEPLWTDDYLDQHYAFGSSGFDALPGGYFEGTFYYQDDVSIFWSSTESSDFAWVRVLDKSLTTIYRFDFELVLGTGKSVRCIKD